MVIENKSTGSKTYDYAVVGGGIVGLSVAWTLAQKATAVLCTREPTTSLAASKLDCVEKAVGG